MSPEAPPKPSRASGRFHGLGELSQRMAVIQHSPVHVNGAYREAKKIARMRI